MKRCETCVHHVCIVRAVCARVRVRVRVHVRVRVCRAVSVRVHDKYLIGAPQALTNRGLAHSRQAVVSSSTFACSTPRSSLSSPPATHLSTCTVPTPWGTTLGTYSSYFFAASSLLRLPGISTLGRSAADFERTSFGTARSGARAQELCLLNCTTCTCLLYTSPSPRD